MPKLFCVDIPTPQRRSVVTTRLPKDCLKKCLCNATASLDLEVYGTVNRMAALSQTL